ncbi:MAG: hypothetical protein JWR67_3446, partial [Mucilaginibacter sp.]|nr:hypothetical protein [Mucilaginibacter sp.]
KMAMKATADSIHYPHAGLSNTHQSAPIKFRHMLTIANKVIIRKNRRLGILLQEGMNEFEMVSILDTYARSFPKSFQCITASDSIIHTKYGITLVHTGGNAVKKIDELHILMPSNNASVNSLYGKVPTIRYANSNLYPIETCLARIDQQYGHKFKTVVKLMLDYN